MATIAAFANSFQLALPSFMQSAAAFAASISDTIDATALLALSAFCATSANFSNVVSIHPGMIVHFHPRSIMVMLVLFLESFCRLILPEPSSIEI